MGIVQGIGRQVPQHDGAAPVAHGADYESFGRCGDVDAGGSGAFGGHLLGEENVLVGAGFVHVGHGAHVAGIVMERRSGHVLCRFGVVVDGQGVVGAVAVVVENDDFRIEPRLAEFRSEVVFDEVGLLPGEPEHAGCIGRTQRLVLDCQGIDRDAVDLHLLHIAHQVVGIDSITLFAQLSAAHVIDGLHPRRSRPGRCQHADVGIDLQNLVHDRNYVPEILREREVFQPEILLAFGHVVVEENETVQVGGPDRQTHAAHAGAFHWIEYVAESRCTGFGRHSHEHLGAAARQGEAETIDRLETLPRVDDDIGTATAAVVAHVGKLVLFGFGVKRGAVGKRNVGTDGLCGCRDGHARQSAGQK